ncbi:glyoxalase superfamily protein [Sneathiella limimaris]|uniref:glyoxalase superfamily protein n=1 Tax=Sneathiella limimaris TaxID=1964213 RepID=UPI00146CAAF5|nr:glyoxalase superfamily protein [Sneathiella limimaris]
MSYDIKGAIPILRIFDIEKAREFYLDFLGFEEDWLHQPEEQPTYRQISRDGLVLHLTEHYADSVPGVRIFIPTGDIEGFHQELHLKSFKFANPGLDTVPWGVEFTVTDPFGNRLTFCKQQSGE